MTNRVFRSGQNSCQVGCSYCFADLPEYSGFPAMPGGAVSLMLKPGQLLYPVCDSDIVFNRRSLKDLISQSKSIPLRTSVSISTKLALSDSILDDLCRLNDILLSKNGILKIAASASVFSEEDRKTYEPHATSVAVRIETLRRAKSRGILTSVTLKPLLPWVDLQSYSQLINEASTVAKFFTLGGLYLSEKTAFGRQTISTYKEMIVERRPDWLSNEQTWFYLEDPQQLQDVKELVQAAGAGWFTSDEDIFRFVATADRFSCVPAANG